MSHIVDVRKQLVVPDHDPRDIDALVTNAGNDGKPMLAIVLRGYARLLRQLATPQPTQRSLSTSDEFNHADAPTLSVEGRYQGILAHLGVSSYEEAILYIDKLHDRANANDPKNAIATQEKVRSDITMKTERVGVYVARLEGETNQAAFSHRPFPHPNAEEAQNEAFRLAKKEPGVKFGVFTCMGMYQIPRQEPVWTHAHCMKED